MLGRSIEKNRLANVKLQQIALGASDGTARLSFPADNAGMGTLTQSEFKGAQILVPVRSLDSIAPELKIDRVRLLKIDVEGFEPEFFRGARRWVSNTPPETILFESNREDGSDQVTTMIADYGYRLYAIPKRLFTLAITPWSGGMPSHDVLAVRKDCERQIVSKFVVAR
jgi:FkbM family methyltransferase